MRKFRTTAILVASAAMTLSALGLGPAIAQAAPEWSLRVTAPDRSAPGETFRYGITPTNVGDTETEEGSLDITLPPGFKGVSSSALPILWDCDPVLDATTIHCEYDPELEGPTPIGPGQSPLLSPILLEVEIEPGLSGTHTAEFQMSGGGAPNVATTTRSIRASATPEFRITEWDGEIATDEEGKLQAGSHPAEITTVLNLSTREDTVKSDLLPETGQRNLVADLPAGFVGAPAAAPTCDQKDLNPAFYEPLPEWGNLVPACPIDSIVGSITVRFASGGPERGIFAYNAPIFNMKPSPGEPARFAFKITDFPQELVANARTDGDLGVQLTIEETSQGLPVTGATTTFWGVPADPSHDEYRCQYYEQKVEVGDNPDGCPGEPGNVANGPNASAIGAPKPFLTLPTSCSAPDEGLRFDLMVDGWAPPHQSDSASFTTDVGTSGCERVPFQPGIEVQPTTDEAETPTGLEVALTVPPDGLENPKGISQSHLKDATVFLPEGMTVNPSQAEGLAVCTPAQIGLTSGDSETIRFNSVQPSCPDASQIGEVRLETPILLEPLTGAVYLAQQSDPTAPGTENPFNSDLALYIAVKGQGILVKLAGEVAPDARTGQIVTRFLNNPQQPFSRFSLKFKGGPRAPLSMPPTCGTYKTEAVLTPWARPGDPVRITDTFTIDKGPNGGPCPSGAVAPFKPGFSAGAINNNAGSYSPFFMRLTRADGEQDMTRFSATLPPGVSAKIAGVEKCSEAAIAAAKAKSGREEQATPSCPASSQIGSILAGAGAGALQVYVPGKIYLAGPFAGAPLSAVVITPAVAGPFDVGTVVTREALTLDPVTAEVHVDGEKSDPIPHILRGIPLKVRDIRVSVDRPSFTLNPTSCDPSEVGATLWGSFLDLLSPADDVPVPLAARFQAASCGNLGFKPQLSLRLKGGTKRGDFPALRAVLKARLGDANIGRASVTLPNSAFLEQAHIRTICTRVQYAANHCPKGAIYGYARAFTPLLDEPLEGPVYLRSSNNKLPDIVAALRGIVDIDVAGRIDSVKGGIRSTFTTVPDAPVTKFVLTMQGGKKGLVVNSRNLCRSTNRAKARFIGQNGRAHNFNPIVKPSCSVSRKAKRSARD